MIPFIWLLVIGVTAFSRTLWRRLDKGVVVLRLGKTNTDISNVLVKRNYCFDVIFRLERP